MFSFLLNLTAGEQYIVLLIDESIVEYFIIGLLICRCFYFVKCLKIKVVWRNFVIAEIIDHCK